MQKIKLLLSAEELHMLVLATGGPVFSSTINRDIPVSENWTKEDALSFESYINSIYTKQAKSMEIDLSKKELQYLVQIHNGNIQELDSIEYPTITGHDWEDAILLLEKLNQTLM